jgi:uncharacterized membrane protein
MKKALIWSGLTVLIELVAAVIIFPHLPSQIPTHWGISGAIDQYSGKWFIFFPAILSLVMTILLYYVPKIDPKGKNIVKSGKAYPLLIVAINLLFLALFMITIFATFNETVPVDKMLCALIGLLFIIIGNYMPKIKPNYTFGIRFPATLNNEEVWKKVHRVGGWVFVIMGLLFVFGMFLPISYNFIVPMSGVIAGTLGLFVYSVVLGKKGAAGL